MPAGVLHTMQRGLRVEMDGRAESEGVAAVADAIDNLKRIRKSQ